MMKDYITPRQRMSTYRTYSRLSRLGFSLFVVVLFVIEGVASWL
jgi:hypothetical protein